MLYLTRKKGQALIINHETLVEVKQVLHEEGRVKLGIVAPQEVPVDRGEVRERKLREGPHRTGAEDRDAAAS